MPPSRVMPPPPAIGSARSPAKPKGEEGKASEAARDPGERAPRTEEPDESTTSQWPTVNAEIAEDDGPSDHPNDGPNDGPSDGPGSRSLPPLPHAPTLPAIGRRPVSVPPIEASSSSSSLRVPSIEASSSSSGLRVPSLDRTSSRGGLPASLPSAEDSAAAWPAADGWDLDDDAVPGPAAAPATAAKPARVARSTPAPLPPSPSVPLAPPPPTLGSQPKPMPRPISRPPLAASPLAPEPARAPEPAGASETGAASGSEPEDARAHETAVDDEGPPDDPVPAVPRLPLPGMLRDGPVPKAADFRAAARPRPATAAAMSPPSGMIPPRHLRDGDGDGDRDGDEGRLLGSASDTMSFVAQVATDLIARAQADAPKQDESSAWLQAQASAEPTPAAESTERGAPVPFVAGATAAVAPEGTVPIAVATVAEAQANRRGLLMGMGLIGAAAAIAFVVWLALGDDPPTVPPQTAAVVEPPPEPEGPLAAVVASTGPEAAPSDPSPTDAPAAAGTETGALGPGDTDSGSGVDSDTDTGDSEADPDAETSTSGDEPEPDAVEVASASPSKSRRGSSKASRASKAKPKDEPKPAPAKVDDAPSAKDLLGRARSAYRSGKGSTAYGLASKSNRMQPSSEAAEVMTLAACQMNDADKARNALKNVPLLRRGSVRSTCKSKHGVRLGL